MSQSHFLSLPFIQPSQAQKHVTHNEALVLLDALVHFTSETRPLDVPPSSPNAGDRYIVGSNPQGSWEGHPSEIAIFNDQIWLFLSPVTGWQAWVSDENTHYIFDGNDWAPISKGQSENENPSLLGINTTADAHNRLSVKSDSILLSHDDVTPGNGDLRLSLNKKADDDVASLIFQSGFQSFAEMGLAGSNDFVFNVVDDDGNFTPAISIDHNSGKVSFPNSPTLGEASTGPLDTLTIFGTGGSRNTSNGLHFNIETDPFNPTTAACIIHPDNPGARLIFGSASSKFFSLNFSNVTTIERMPRFTTTDALSFGYSTVGSHNIGRTGNKIEYHSCAPTDSGHRFFANTGTYSRTGETLVLYVQQDEITLNAPAIFAAPARLANYELSALPDASTQEAGALIFVNGTGNTSFVAVSDGTNWRRLSDEVI